MARFISIPSLDISDKKEQWILAENLRYQSDLSNDAGKPTLVIVPKGFITDLASIPKIFRFLIIKNGRHRLAAIVHDYLCSLGLRFSRVTADKIFLEAMKISGVPKIRRRLMYIAVALNTSVLKLMGKAR